MCVIFDAENNSDCIGMLVKSENLSLAQHIRPVLKFENMWLSNFLPCALFAKSARCSSIA